MALTRFVGILLCAIAATSHATPLHQRQAILNTTSLETVSPIHVNSVTEKLAQLDLTATASTVERQKEKDEASELQQSSLKPLETLQNANPPIETSRSQEIVSSSYLFEGQQGHYRMHLDKCLGKGSYGSVFYSEKLGLSHEAVAIKRSYFKNSIPSTKFDLLVGHLLWHPNIVRTRDFAWEANEEKGGIVLFQVMPLIRGMELHHWLSRAAPLSEDQARLLMRQLVSAVAYMHYFGIVHMDLKLSNVMVDLTDNMKIYIMDFSLAQCFSSNEDIGKAQGTVGYVAPEVIVSMFRKTNPAFKRPDVADIFSLGVMLHGALTGNLPFPFNRKDPDARSRYISNLHSIEKGYEPNSEWSVELQTLLRSMLAFNPDERPTAKELLSHPWFTDNGRLPPVDPLLPKYDHPLTSNERESYLEMLFRIPFAESVLETLNLKSSYFLSKKYDVLRELFQNDLTQPLLGMKWIFVLDSFCFMMRHVQIQENVNSLDENNE